MKRSLRGDRHMRRGGSLSIVDWLALLTTGFYLLISVFGGAVRHYAASVGAEELVYLPKVVAIACVAISLLDQLSRGRGKPVFLVTLIAVAMSTLVGYAYVGRALQVGFGLWIIVPLLLGMVAASSVSKVFARLLPFTVIIWAIAVMGVLLDVFVSLPWEGSGYSIGEIWVSASREWYTSGIPRLAGFSQGSIAAANQILFFGILVLTLIKGAWWRFLVWLISLSAILLTTMKTPLFAWLILGMYLVVRGIVPRVLLRVTPLIVSGFAIALPVAAYVLSQYEIHISDMSLGMWFQSFGTRLSATWPNALKMIGANGNVLVGRGMGGIGTPQKYFEPLLYSPGDSILVYLYGVLGVLGIAVLIWYAKRGSAAAARRDAQGQFVFMVSLAVLLMGVTSNIVESAEASLFLGLSSSIARPQSTTATAEAKPPTRLAPV